VERGGEEARARRWAAVPAVAAINGVRLGVVAVLGEEEVRSQRVGVRALVGRWSGAGEPGKWRRGAGGGAAVGRKGAAGLRWETSPTGGPHLSARGRERRGEAALMGRRGPKASAGPRSGLGRLDWFCFFSFLFFSNQFQTNFSNHF
jgi:hypothetical protein